MGSVSIPLIDKAPSPIQRTTASRNGGNTSLPTSTVAIETRGAMTGLGLVLRVRNTSKRQLAFLVSVKNPTTHQQRDFRVDTGPSGSAELGFKEGWTLASGDVITIKHNDYQAWHGSVP